jgi:hypothetical protein
MHTQIGWMHTVTLIGCLGLSLTIAAAGNALSSSSPSTAAAQSSAASGTAPEPLRQELDQLKRTMQAIQDRIQELEKQQADKPAAEPAKSTPQPGQPAPAPPAPAYGNILPGMRVGGYGSFRFEASSLDDVGNTFTFRRFVLSLDTAIAERLRLAIEVEFERFTSLELERSTTSSNGGLRVEQAIEGSGDTELSLEQAWLNGLLRELTFANGAVTELERENRYIDRITAGRGSYRYRQPSAQGDGRSSGSSLPARWNSRPRGCRSTSAALATGMRWIGWDAFSASTGCVMR